MRIDFNGFEMHLVRKQLGYTFGERVHRNPSRPEDEVLGQSVLDELAVFFRSVDHGIFLDFLYPEMEIFE